MNPRHARTRRGRIALHCATIARRINRCVRDCFFDLCGILRECWPR